MASQMDHERLRGVAAGILVLAAAVGILGAVQALASRSALGVAAAVAALLLSLAAAERLGRAVRR